MRINSVFSRLIIANLIILMFLAIFMSYIFHKTQSLSTQLHKVTVVELPLIEKTEKLNSLIQGISEFREKYLISRDEDFLIRYREYKNASAALMNEIGNLTESDAKFETFYALSSEYSRYITESELRLNAPFKTRQPQKAELINQANELRNLAITARTESLSMSGTLSSEVKSATSVFILTGFAVIVLLAFLNTRNIVAPIKKLRESTYRVSKGNYSESINPQGPDEIKQLTEDFSIMISRLKENDELRAEFISNVSHELRTPLTTIREASGMLKENCFAEDKNSTDNLLNIIHSESERMIHSVGNILEITRLDMAENSCTLEHVNPRETVNSAIVKTSPIAIHKNINIISNLSETCPEVITDRDELLTVLVNLIGNALKFSEKDTQVEIDSCIKDGFLMISVNDQGPPISSDEAGIIFGRYRQGSSKSSEYKGSGLGLAICRKIIEKHGGKIWVESREGKGNSFCFTMLCA